MLALLIINHKAYNYCKGTAVPGGQHGQSGHCREGNYLLFSAYVFSDLCFCVRLCIEN